jgi:hypothetical protein
LAKADPISVAVMLEDLSPLLAEFESYLAGITHALGAPSFAHSAKNLR